MKDLTTQDFNVLFGKIKSFLGITWEDPDTNTNVADAIKTSISFLNNTAGVELDYLCSPANTGLYAQMSYAGYELLKNRVFYIREKALDDFNKNYLTDINNLALNGRIYKNVNQQQDVQER